MPDGRLFHWTMVRGTKLCWIYNLLSSGRKNDMRWMSRSQLDQGHRSVVKSVGGGGGGWNRRKVAAGSASLLASGGVVSPPTGSGTEPREPSTFLTKNSRNMGGEKWSKGAQ